MPFVLIPIVTTALTTIGVSAAAAAVAAPLVAGLILVAGSLLLTLALTKGPPKPDDGKFVIQQSTPPRSFVYGDARWAGYAVFLEEKDGPLYCVQVLTGHEIEGFLKFFFNDDILTLSETDHVIAGEDGRYGSNQIKVMWRLGVVPETAYTEIAAAVSEWTDLHRGDGCASIAYIADDVHPQEFSKIYPYGRPMLSAALQGYKVWDPRDAAQSRTNAATWEFSRNPVLCILHHQCFSEYGPQKDFDIAIAPVLDLWIAQANICDESITLFTTGTEKRYELGGVGTTEVEPKAILAQMLLACDGWMAERGDGALILYVGKWYTPTITIEDNDILGFSYQNDIADEDVINRLGVTFTSPLHDYSETECDPWIDEADQLTRGHVREGTYQLLWVQTYTRARRIAKREFYRQQNRLRGSLTLRLSALDALYERYLKIESTVVPRLNNVTIEVRGGKIQLMEGCVTIEFIEMASAIDTWTPADDEGEAPPVPDRPGTSGSSFISQPPGIVRSLVGTGDDPTALKVTLEWRNPNSQNFSYVNIYRGRTNVFASATFLDKAYGAPSLTDSYEDTVTFGGYWFYFLKAANGAGVEAAEVSTATTDNSQVLVAFDSATTAWVAALSVDPGNFRKQAVDRVIRRLKLAGIWNKLDALYLFAAHNQTDAKINLKDPGTYNCTEVGTLTFTTDRGFTGNGSTGNLQTGFTPSTAGSPKYVQDSAHLAAWAGLDIQETTRIAGVVTGSTHVSQLIPRTLGGNLSGLINQLSGGTAVSFTVADARAFICVNRSGATAHQLYRNGVSVDTDTQASSGVPTTQIAFLRGLGSFSNNRIAAGCFGESLSSSLQTELYNTLLEYMTEVGVV